MSLISYICVTARILFATGVMSGSTVPQAAHYTVLESLEGVEVRQPMSEQDESFLLSDTLHHETKVIHPIELSNALKPLFVQASKKEASAYAVLPLGDSNSLEQQLERSLSIVLALDTSRWQIAGAPELHVYRHSSYGFLQKRSEVIVPLRALQSTR